MLAVSTVSRIVRATLVIAALAVVTTGAVLWTQGYRVYVVHTGSMSPTYKPGDVVIDKPAHGHYHAGEVITFRHSDQTTDVVTHRITKITKTGLIHTKGDADRTADPWTIRPDQVKGKVGGSVRHLGYLLVFLHQPAGDAAVVTAALGILLLWKVFFPDEPTQPSVPSVSSVPVPAEPITQRDLEDDTEVPNETTDDTDDDADDDADVDAPAFEPLDALLTLI